MFRDTSGRSSSIAMTVAESMLAGCASIKRSGRWDGAAGTGKALHWVAILPAMALVACGTDEGAEAEKRYEMVKRNGTKGELCAAGREVAQTYLRLADEPAYERWNVTSRIECQLAELTSPDLPATEGESYKKAKADSEAVARQVDEAARQAIEEFQDEGIGSTPATDEAEPE